MIKLCVVCGKVFDAWGAAGTCGAGCRKDHRKAYHQTQKYKDYHKAYRQTQKCKDGKMASAKVYKKSLKYKLYQKNYRQTHKTQMKAYGQSPRRKAYCKAHSKSCVLLHPKTQNFFQLLELTKTLKQYENDQNSQLSHHH